MSSKSRNGKQNRICRTVSERQIFYLRKGKVGADQDNIQPEKRSGNIRFMDGSQHGSSCTHGRGEGLYDKNAEMKLENLMFLICCLLQLEVKI